MDSSNYNEFIRPFLVKHDDNIIYSIQGNYDPERIYQYHSHCKCFFTNCNVDKKNTYTVLYSCDDTILVGFSTHTRNCYVIDELDIDYNLFDFFIKELIKIISKKEYSTPIKLLLFGYSFGMSYATITAYILLRLICDCNGDQIFESVHSNLETSICMLLEGALNLSILLNLEISVIGCGGIPILFTKESDFINFFNLLQKRYINFYNSGTMLANITQFDKVSLLGDPYVYKLECNSVIFKNYVVHSLLTCKKLKDVNAPSRKSNPYIIDRIEKSITKIPYDELPDDDLCDEKWMMEMYKDYHEIYTYIKNIKDTIDSI